MKIIEYIKKKSNDFLRYDVSNPMCCLLQILNLLDEEDEKNGKLDCFELVYEPRCECTSKDNIFVLHCHFIKSGEFCAVCKKPIKYFILSCGPYLIVMPS